MSCAHLWSLDRVPEIDLKRISVLIEALALYFYRYTGSVLAWCYVYVKFSVSLQEPHKTSPLNGSLHSGSPHIVFWVYSSIIAATFAA